MQIIIHTYYTDMLKYHQKDRILYAHDFMAAVKYTNAATRLITAQVYYYLWFIICSCLLLLVNS